MESIIIFRIDPSIVSFRDRHIYLSWPRTRSAFHSTYDHIESKDTYVKCDRQQIVQREQRPSKKPKIQYELIASGNQVMKMAGLGTTWQRSIEFSASKWKLLV
jgi:hypothetical protein